MTQAADAPAVALTIAGSDSSGGAGIQADLKTFQAFGVFGTTVITALTAQNTKGVSAIHTVPPAFIAAQFDAVITDLPVAAIKTGMLGDDATVRCVARLLARVPDAVVVVDPVMVATSGDVLLARGAIETLKEHIVPKATLLTPNLAEAAILLGQEQATDVASQTAQARALCRLGCAAVLLKGGHAAERQDDVVDILATDHSVKIFSARRIATQNTHGTGCTLAAAITAGLANGLDLARAIADAKDFVTRALAAAANWELGRGAGPIDHRVGPYRDE